jgi:hypothetical protein
MKYYLSVLGIFKNEKVDTRPHVQVGHYNSYMEQIKQESEWVMVRIK